MKNAKIIVSGGNGHFAKCLKQIDNNIITLSKEEMNIRSYTNIVKQIEHHHPDYFIHAGAMTRPISRHEQNPDQSIANNIIGTCNVVLSCMDYHVKLIYISTDYVYPGTQGNYKETDPILPFTKYGWSKLGGECAVHMCDNSLIIRTGMCNRPFPHDQAICDNKKGLIWDEEVAKITLQLLDEKGIINISGPPRSYYEFAIDNGLKVQRIYMKDVNKNSIASNCSLNTDKMESILNVH